MASATATDIPTVPPHQPPTQALHLTPPAQSGDVDEALWVRQQVSLDAWDVRAALSREQAARLATLTHLLSKGVALEPAQFLTQFVTTGNPVLIDDEPDDDVVEDRRSYGSGTPIGDELGPRP